MDFPHDGQEISLRGRHSGKALVESLKAA